MGVFLKISRTRVCNSHFLPFFILHFAGSREDREGAPEQELEAGILELGIKKKRATGLRHVGLTSWFGRGTCRGQTHNAHYIMGSTNQTCRNCGGGEFYSKEVELAGQTTFLLPIGFTLAPRNLRLRVCGTCGLMDWFVASISLDKVKEKFQKDS